MTIRLIVMELGRFTQFPGKFEFLSRTRLAQIQIDGKSINSQSPQPGPIRLPLL